MAFLLPAAGLRAAVLTPAASPPSTAGSVILSAAKDLLSRSSSPWEQILRRFAPQDDRRRSSGGQGIRLRMTGDAAARASARRGARPERRRRRCGPRSRGFRFPARRLPGDETRRCRRTARRSRPAGWKERDRTIDGEEAVARKRTIGLRDVDGDLHCAPPPCFNEAPTPQITSFDDPALIALTARRGLGSGLNSLGRLFAKRTPRPKASARRDAGGPFSEVALPRASRSAR